jgi:hypothetical protein
VKLDYAVSMVQKIQPRRGNGRPISAFRSTAVMVSVASAILASRCTGENSNPGCVSDSECNAGAQCRLGQCRSAPDAGMPRSVLGAACAMGSECESGFCADGVCCASACNLGCGVCNAAGSVGTCKPKPKDDACGGFLCDGTSATCPSSCTSSTQCGQAYACCLDGNAEYSECNVLGQAKRCTKLKPCSSIADNFSGDTLKSTVWARQPGTNGIASVSNGRLSLNTGSGTDENGYRYTNISSTQRCSFFGDVISVEAVDVSQMAGASDGGNVVLAMEAVWPEGRHVCNVSLFRLTELTSITSKADGGETVVIAPGTFDISAMRYWRIAEKDGFATVSYSSTGKDNVIFDRKPHALHAGDTRIVIRSFVDRPVRDAGPTFLLDNFNITP